MFDSHCMSVSNVLLLCLMMKYDEVDWVFIMSITSIKLEMESGCRIPNCLFSRYLNKGCCPTISRDLLALSICFCSFAWFYFMVVLK